MFLPSELISTVACGQAKYPSLYLSVPRHYNLMWLVETDQKKYAVTLNGTSAGSGTEVIEQTGDYGVQIYPISIRLNPAAAAPMGMGWNLQAVDNALMLGFAWRNQRVWAPVADLTNTVTVEQQGLYFREWSAGIEISGEWIELVTSRDHDFTTNPELTAVVP